MATLIQALLPGSTDEKVAAIMEAILPAAEESFLPVDATELRAVLGGDASILEAREQEAKDPTSQRASMQKTIAEQAAKLRQRGHIPKATQAAAAPGGLQAPEAGQHWVGKGDSSWTAEVICGHSPYVYFYKSRSYVMFNCDVPCSKEIEAWLPPGYRCGAKPHQDSWSISYNGKHLAKRSFKKYGGEDGAVFELAQQAWLHAQSLNPALLCPHASLFPKSSLSPTASASSNPQTLQSSSSSSGSNTVPARESARQALLVVAATKPPSAPQDELTLAEAAAAAAAASQPPSKKRRR